MVSLSMPPARWRSRAASCAAARAGLRYLGRLVFLLIVDQLRQNAVCHIFVDRALGLGEINLGELAIGFELVGLQIRLTVLGETESENGPAAGSGEQERPVGARAAGGAARPP